jgi:hypothetical protein
MDISKAAAEIINEARFNSYDLDNIIRLIEKHGVAAAAEAISVLARVLPQGANVPYRRKA